MCTIFFQKLPCVCYLLWMRTDSRRGVILQTPSGFFFTWLIIYWVGTDAIVVVSTIVGRTPNTLQYRKDHLDSQRGSSLF